MRQPLRARALFIVSFVVVLATAQDSAEIDRTMSAVPMPGGLAGRAALGERDRGRRKPAPGPDPALVPDAGRDEGTAARRGAPPLSPFDHSTQAQTLDVVPLPLTPAFWTATVLGGRSTPETLLRDLLRSRRSSYCAPRHGSGTREWVASNPRC